MLLIDAERPLEHQDLTIGDLVTEEGRALVIAVNKWDLVEDKQKLLKELREDAGRAAGAGAGRRAGAALGAERPRHRQAVDAPCSQAYDLWNRRVSTPRSQPLAPGGAGAPLAARRRRPAHQAALHHAAVDAAADVRGVLLAAEDLPKSYIRYLTNSLREAFDLPGVPLRFNLRKGDNPFAKHKS